MYQWQQMFVTVALVSLYLVSENRVWLKGSVDLSPP